MLSSGQRMCRFLHGQGHIDPFSRIPSRSHHQFLGRWVLKMSPSKSQYTRCGRSIFRFGNAGQTVVYSLSVCNTFWSISVSAKHRHPRSHELQLRPWPHERPGRLAVKLPDHCVYLSCRRCDSVGVEQHSCETAHMNPDVFLDTVAKTVIHKSCVEFGRSLATLHCRWGTG